jgi:hypothetical protein
MVGLGESGQVQRRRSVQPAVLVNSAGHPRPTVARDPDDVPSTPPSRSPQRRCSVKNPSRSLSRLTARKRHRSKVR